MTLAQVAAACTPPTTAQTVGRLETGMRNLSLDWMNRIAAALGVEPQALLRADEREPPRFVARLTREGAEPLRTPREAVLPGMAAEGEYMVLAVEDSGGEYRAGDQVWLRRHPPEDAHSLVNRDVLVPRPGGRFAFGRLFDRAGTRVGLLPPASGQRQVIVENPAWIAAAEMLVRKV